MLMRGRGRRINMIVDFLSGLLHESIKAFKVRANSQTTMYCQEETQQGGKHQ